MENTYQTSRKFRDKTTNISWKSNKIITLCTLRNQNSGRIINDCKKLKQHKVVKVSNKKITIFTLCAIKKGE